VPFARRIAAQLDRRLTTFRSAAILGARQVGKSFFLRAYAKERDGLYFSFDDPLVRADVMRDPLGWLDGHRDPRRLCVLDEAVRCPEIFSAVPKRAR
jgi:predicted AAA+ superfamily ATPase